MSHWKLVVVAVIAILVIIIVIQNTQEVETKLLLVTVTMPRAVLLFVTLLVGYVLGIVTIFTIKDRSKEKPQSDR